MPVSREDTATLAELVSSVYADVEVRLLRLIARHLQAGADAPDWAEAKLAEVQLFRRRAQSIVHAARAEAVGQLAAVLERAYLRGAASAQGDLDRLGRETDLPVMQAERAVAALVSGMTEQLESLDLPVVRAGMDAYMMAVSNAVSGTLTGATTRLQDAQHALDDLASRGLKAFTDTAGRRWALASYVEMATRTTTAQAAVQGHLDRLEQAGIPLVIVSNSSRECERCRPWEGKVLSRGPMPAIMGDAATGKSIRVQVDGTLQQALSAGLMHPNCTHSLSAYIPGATKRGGATANPTGYAEKQEQRRLERKVREWKRREAAALTPEAQRKAQGKVRGWQGQLKAHTDATGLPRKRNRESLTAAR
jgi:hypothetical protein